jgi:hypothetical protein
MGPVFKEPKVAFYGESKQKPLNAAGIQCFLLFSVIAVAIMEPLFSASTGSCQ